ncbi:GntR family transcriptional regulator [Aquabacter spiritensis]|uniref:DNA-binding GntR family transcriptional regulator n=1 Tax=Aquabacter spiritensis TaxID=933073 RepID=A0A4R3LUW7_9HYPH|nr:GntR family transcriptional regulator [Aquabacter spiritensis]TCT04324.1 DNA-binding GntR family transcriptional regulator [Aquabacter spiritensis]
MGSAGNAMLHDELVAHLRAMIVDGVLPPGTRVPERELCAKFEVSRTPLREALKVLAAEGHIALLPNKGARVTRLTTRDVEELFQVSGGLEALGGELACARITDAEIAEIRALHAEMAQEHARRALPAYYALNRRIHEAIMQASGNKVLQGLYEQVSARIRRARFVAAMPFDRWDQAMDEHEGILNALVRRDGATLAAILKQHLSNKSKQVVEAGFAVEVDAAADPAAPRRRGRRTPPAG